MKDRILAIALFAVIAALPASARAQDAPAYCAKAGGDLLLGTIQPQNEEAIYRICREGDIINIPARYTVTIARVCDFTKQIVVRPGDSTLCVIVPLRGYRPPK